MRPAPLKVWPADVVEMAEPRDVLGVGQVPRIAEDGGRVVRTPGHVRIQEREHWCGCDVDRLRPHAGAVGGRDGPVPRRQVAVVPEVIARAERRGIRGVRVVHHRRVDLNLVAVRLAGLVTRGQRDGAGEPAQGNPGLQARHGQAHPIESRSQRHPVRGLSRGEARSRARRRPTALRCRGRGTPACSRSIM